MIILDVFPKDVHVKLELSVSQITYILDYLDRCTFDASIEPYMSESAREYVEKTFFKELDMLTEKMKEQLQ